MGARIFEIHVTDDRSRNDIRDHALSRTPVELSLIIRQLSELNSALMSGPKSIQPSERISLNSMRKGLVYSKNLSAGHKLLVSDLDFARPLNTEVHSADRVIGKILKRNVNAFFTISLDDFE